MSIALVFPGQASQYTGMGRELYDNIPEARMVYDQASSVLNYDVAQLCFQGPDEKLRQTLYTQPAILATSLACMAALISRVGKKNFTHTAGHSLGEYAALVAAGILDISSAMALIQKRAQFMSQITGGTMAAVMGLDGEKVQEILNQFNGNGVAQMSIVNSPGQIVISGDQETLEMAAVSLKEGGARRVEILNVSGPFHCSMMKPAAIALADELHKKHFDLPKMKFYPNVTAKSVNDANDIRDYLVQQMTSPVLWENTIREMVDDGVKTFIEVGPKAVLSGLIKRTVKDIRLMRVEDMETLNKTVAELGDTIEAEA